VLTTTATPTSPPGDYPIVISTGTLVAPNYSFDLINGTLTILPAGSYTISSNPASLTIPAGESRQATITLTPVNLYQGTVTLSCGQLPANVTCIFSPSTYTFTGATTVNNTANPIQGTLTINTLGGETVVGALRPGASMTERASMLLVPAGLAGLLLMCTRRRAARRHGIWHVCILAVLAVASIGLTSCGGASSKAATATPGTSSVVITGIGTTPDGSGTVAASMSLNVTVQ
jgi:hypothetical protein